MMATPPRAANWTPGDSVARVEGRVDAWGQVLELVGQVPSAV
jgi:hypothetical protein